MSILRLERSFISHLVLHLLICVQLLQEAITVARTSGDKIALQHCIRWTVLTHSLLPEVDRVCQLIASFTSDRARTKTCLKHNTA